jgi:hypothetical protein
MNCCVPVYLQDVDQYQRSSFSCFQYRLTSNSNCYVAFFLPERESCWLNWSLFPQTRVKRYRNNRRLQVSASVWWEKNSGKAWWDLAQLKVSADTRFCLVRKNSAGFLPNWNNWSLAQLCLEKKCLAASSRLNCNSQDNLAWHGSVSWPA